MLLSTWLTSLKGRRRNLSRVRRGRRLRLFAPRIEQLEDHMLLSISPLLLPLKTRSQLDAPSPDVRPARVTKAFPNIPVLGKPEVGLPVHFKALQGIPLETDSFVDNDRLRVAALSSMFSSETVIDANVIR